MKTSANPEQRALLSAFDALIARLETECRHGVSMEHNCNGCSDSGDDPRTAAQS